MATVQEIANWIVAAFDMQESVKLDALIERVLQQQGVPRFAASTEAIAKTDKVLAELQSRRPQDLPFDFHGPNEYRLVGKQRSRPSDSPATAEVRERLALLTPMLETVYACGDITFEKICAGLMHLSGASDAYATCSVDDGGIDVYGRLPLRLPDAGIGPNLIGTCLLDRKCLYLGQCKCYAPTVNIGRPELDSFHGAAESCLLQYDGNHRPPSHRVPSSFYRKNEMCFRLFFTTAGYADTAVGAANALDIILITGRQIAEFLVYHKVGLSDSGVITVNQSALVEWADAFGPATRLPSSM